MSLLISDKPFKPPYYRVCLWTNKGEVYTFRYYASDVDEIVARYCRLISLKVYRAVKIYRHDERFPFLVYYQAHSEPPKHYKLIP